MSSLYTCWINVLYEYDVWNGFILLYPKMVIAFPEHNVTGIPNSNIQKCKVHIKIKVLSCSFHFVDILTKSKYLVIFFLSGRKIDNINDYLGDLPYFTLKCDKLP